MRYLFGFMCVCALGVMPMIGCSDNEGTGGSGGSAGTGGNGGTGGSGGMGCTGGNVASFPVKLTGWDPIMGATDPLEGVELCQVGANYCVTTDGGGETSVCLPIGEEVAFTYAKEGYQSYLNAGIVPPVPFLLEGTMSTTQRLADMHAIMMSPYPMEGTGDILIISIEGALPGATLEIAGSTAKRFYHDEDGNWDPELTATTSFGPWGGFTEVSPGEVEITWGGTAEGCGVFKGWPSDKENTMRLPVIAGFLTQADLTCPSQ